MNVLDVLARTLERSPRYNWWVSRLSKRDHYRLHDSAVIDALDQLAALRAAAGPGPLVITEEGELARLELFGHDSGKTATHMTGPDRGERKWTGEPLYRLVPVGGEPK